jgi:hypothetical protein
MSSAYFHCRLNYKILLCRTQSNSPPTPTKISGCSGPGKERCAPVLHALLNSPPTPTNLSGCSGPGTERCAPVLHCFIVARDTAAHSLIKHAGKSLNGKSLNGRRGEGAGWAWPCTCRRPHC